MRDAPTVFVLVRGSDVGLRTESAMNHFVELSCYNPHSAFYVDKMNPYINNKGIKPTNRLDKFNVLPENSFKNWEELAVHAGVGTNIEQPFGMRKQTHCGRASAQPIPHSKLDNGILLALCLQFHGEDPQPEVPRLTVGDPVTVDFYHYKDSVASPHLWRGKVVAPGIATAIGQCKLDKCPYKMTVRHNEVAKYAGKEELLKELRDLFLCKNHEGNSNKSLYYDVLEEDSDKYASILPELLNSSNPLSVTCSSTRWLTCSKIFLSYPTLPEHLPPRLDKGKGRAVEPIAAEPVAADTPPMDSDDEEPDEYKEGRITHACFQNETVDYSYHQFVKILTKVCELMGVPMKLFVRCHSIQTEQKALLAMLDPEFDLTFNVDAPKKDPKFIKRNDLFKGATVEHLLNHYLRHYQTTSDGITDRRFQKAQGSAAWAILQPARFPSTNILESSRLGQLLPVVHAARDLRTEGKMSAEAKKEVSQAFNVAFRSVMERAPVVCCTASIAASSRFQLIRQANAVCIEEAGRGTDLDLMGFFSHYWDARRFVVGCWNQLGPNPFGPQLENPFQAQLSTSPLARFHISGFPIKELSQTARFTNKEMLELCQTLNNAPNVTEVPGSFDNAIAASKETAKDLVWTPSSPSLSDTVDSDDAAAPPVTTRSKRARKKQDISRASEGFSMSGLDRDICGGDG
ncbi:hypothetical protein C7974DRAFT_470774 [Boeremia exigua]|uniref:uncharacterized protein n=1 Tax=Boeremia exigua TaxID=749465 RepID=UPI001E8D2973|nr:uncharacterized protein C7974DRAFT_470774 [Boeremia exigua]KAH6637956.1 hypothetical protein C7974DRAFT_470774 [Boeremia exigua]